MNNRSPELSLTKKIGLGISLALLMFGLIGCGKQINEGSTIWVTGNGVHCIGGGSLSPGSYPVNISDYASNLIVVDGQCSLDANNVNIRLNQPISTTPEEPPQKYNPFKSKGGVLPPR